MTKIVSQAQIVSFRKTIDALIRVFKVSEGVEHPELAKPLSQTDVQSLLFVVARPLSIGTDLGQHLGVVPTTTSAIVDRLVRNNLVERCRVDSNRRIVQLKPTDLGLRVASQIIAEQEENCRIMLQVLPAAERQSFVQQCTKIAMAIEDEFQNANQNL